MRILARNDASFLCNLVGAASLSDTTNSQILVLGMLSSSLPVYLLSKSTYSTVRGTFTK